MKIAGGQTLGAWGGVSCSIIVLFPSSLSHVKLRRLNEMETGLVLPGGFQNSSNGV